MRIHLQDFVANRGAWQYCFDYRMLYITVDDHDHTFSTDHKFTYRL